MSEKNRSVPFAGTVLLMQERAADVSRIRERRQRHRLRRAVLVLAAADAYLWYRMATGNPFGLPRLPQNWVLFAPLLLLLLLFGALMLLPLASGRSPHVLIRPEHIEVGLDDVQGLDPQVDEVMRTLNVFLGYATFRDALGGNPRRGVLFEGPPGTGKTYLAKAMAKQAGVPFLFASAPAFQSMWYGMTNVKIRSFFRALRTAARKEGGAIGFIEEIDAIGATRGGAQGFAADAPSPMGRSVAAFGAAGTSGIVNELLIQMQSFDQPPLGQRLRERLREWVNGYLPEDLRRAGGKPTYHNILLIAATNRAGDLDQALLRPGRFDRRLYFDPPTRQGRRDLIDFFLVRKSHGEELDGEAARDRLAHDTFGYTPVMIEHLFDEALLLALRDGRDAMSVRDVYEAKLTEEIGLSQAVAYTEEERRAVATHEAGHAVAAHVMGTTRRLEVLSIIKRRSSLGLLAHTDLEERFTKSRSELEALLGIALGGLVAEELFLGETGTGPGSDLTTATEIAALMVGALGMGGSVVSYEAVQEGFGPKNLVAKVLADPDAKARLESLVRTQKQRIRKALRQNVDLVMALRDALIQRDELVGQEILEVIDAAKARRPAGSIGGGRSALGVSSRIVHRLRSL